VLYGSETIFAQALKYLNGAAAVITVSSWLNSKYAKYWLAQGSNLNQGSGYKCDKIRFSCSIRFSIYLGLNMQFNY
jgi:hypothetical protein